MSEREILLAIQSAWKKLKQKWFVRGPSPEDTKAFMQVVEKAMKLFEDLVKDSDSKQESTK